MQVNIIEINIELFLVLQLDLETVSADTAKINGTNYVIYHFDLVITNTRLKRKIFQPLFSELYRHHLVQATTKDSVFC